MPALLGGTGIIGKDIFVKMKAQKSASIQTASGTVVTFPQSEERAFSGLNVYGHSTQSGTPSPDNPVPIVSAGDDGEINVSVSDGGTQSQTLTLSTPGGLPGIPVVSDGNYTDESGQQWVCDEIDLARGKYVHRVGKTVVDGTEIKFTADSTGGYWNLPRQSAPGISEQRIAISKYFPIGVFLGNARHSFLFTTPTLMSPYFSLVDELNAFCAEKYADGQPLEIYYIAAPIETDLPAEEIAAYKALHTYSPTTTVSNDADAWMKVEYNEFNKRTF